ncbi:MAG: hypothetical protein ACK6D7_24495, partial [Acidobacteriota bacterium]
FSTVASLTHHPETRGVFVPFSGVNRVSLFTAYLNLASCRECALNLDPAVEQLPASVLLPI